MDLLTLQFWFLLLFFLVIYYLVPLKIQNVILAAANVLFIYSWGRESLFVLAGSLIISYRVYLKMADANLERPIKKKWITALIVFQIALLFYYKINTAHFPIGISYYTFTIIAFMLEVFWKRTETRLNFLEYITSVSYFPIIMVGPVERLSRFTPQLKNKRTFNPQFFKSGLYYIALGLFKLTAISNPLAGLIKHSEAASLNVYGLGLVFYCILSFFKLYAEFSGFIDVITGISHFLGLKISKNFDQPYFATSVNDVWRRWHISLTSWLRDFVFLPLVLKTKNIIFSSVVVFILVGAWHGLRLHFLYWSLYWIFFYLLHYAYVKGHFKIKPGNFLNSLPLKVLMTFLVTALSTLCFMIPKSGLITLLQRLSKLSPASYHSLLEGTQSLHINLMFVGISILLMICFESHDKKNDSSFFKTKTFFLFFFIALFGEFTLSSLSYLKV